LAADGKLAKGNCIRHVPEALPDHSLAAIWMFDFDLPAIAKVLIAFVLTVFLSWGATTLLRKIPGAKHVLRCEVARSPSRIALEDSIDVRGDAVLQVRIMFHRL
jgi:hypothetical protein